MAGVELPDPDMQKTLADATPYELVGALLTKVDVAFCAYGFYHPTIVGKVDQRNIAGGTAVASGKVKPDHLLMLINNTLHYMIGKSLANGMTLPEVVDVLRNFTQPEEYSDNLAAMMRELVRRN